MKKWSFLFLLLTLNCTSTVEKPDNFIEEEKMVAILTDIYIHQQGSYLGEIQEKNINHSKIDALILQKHQVQGSTFVESYRYYVLNPEKYNTILTKIQGNLEAQLPKEELQKRIDSKEKDNNKKK
ncbi:MAG: DUF4296 domain-containing protein [Moheibacter sp.]